MQKNKSNQNSRQYPPIGLDMGNAPIIEMVSNRQITIEGSTGILLYTSESIKINTSRIVICLEGRGLKLRCISNSCVEIDGFITGIKFLA